MNSLIPAGLIVASSVTSLRLAIAEPVKMPPTGDRPLVSEQQLCTQVLKSEIFARTELLFGLSRTGGPDITEQEFKQFIDTKVTPRFPDGLTLIRGDGQFKDASAPSLRRDPSCSSCCTSAATAADRWIGFVTTTKSCFSRNPCTYR